MSPSSQKKYQTKRKNNFGIQIFSSIPVSSGLKLLWWILIKKKKGCLVIPYYRWDNYPCFVFLIPTEERSVIRYFKIASTLTSLGSIIWMRNVEGVFPVGESTDFSNTGHWWPHFATVRRQRNLDLTWSRNILWYLIGLVACTTNVDAIASLRLGVVHNHFGRGIGTTTHAPFPTCKQR